MVGYLLSYLQGALRISTQLFTRQERSRRRRWDSRLATLHSELLEQRHLLSLNPVFLDADTGGLSIQGTENDDQVTVSTVVPDLIHVRFISEGEVFQTDLPSELVSSLAFFGDDGNDHFENNTDLPSQADGGTGDDVLIGGSNIDNLVGGVGNDRLLGMAGNDSLVGGDGNDLLLGDDGDDYLGGRGGDDVLVGGTGDDRLLGDDGDDVLLGGSGRDNLQGMEGGDLLIGGTTLYDDDLVKLYVLQYAWTSAGSYADRTELIESPSVAIWLESGETVLDDQVADTIFGGEGEDWFFVTGSVPIYDPLGSATHEHDGTDQSADHHHDMEIVTELPALEGFDLIDSFDKVIDRQSGEAVHTKLPHADDPVKQREHLTTFELVRYDEVTHTAVTNGAWSDPDTWENGVVPTRGAHVLIPMGVTVTVERRFIARLDTLRVDGLLRFATNRDTELRVDTAVVTHVGRLEMGTEQEPIQAEFTARMLFINDGPIDRAKDPFGLSRGLISHGSVSIHGAEVTSYAAVLSNVFAGTRVMALKDFPVGWKVGDTVVIAGTTPGTEQNETRQIVYISGHVILLDQPLSYSHVPPSSDAEVHIANVTRNAVFESESSNIERRGHVMFMHNRDVDVAYAGFYRLGRTNKLEPINDPVVDSNWVLQPGTGTNLRARYPVHFHRNGFINDGNPAVVRGSAVVDAPGWGFVNHSSYVDMVDNVAVDVAGSAFSTEVGDEIGSFVGNLAIGTVGSGDGENSRNAVQDFGHTGDGFWFQGAGVSVRDNISAGNNGAAFAYYTRGLIESGVQKEFLSTNLPDPSIADGADTIDVGQVPVLEFDNNVGYASSIGLLVRYHLQNAPHEAKSLLENSTFWNNGTGIGLPYSQNLILRNLTVLYEDGVRPPTGVGISVETGNILYDNLTISGYHRGIVVPRRGYTIIQGGHFNNAIDIIIQTPVTPNRSVTLTGLTGDPRIGMSVNEKPIFDSVNHLFYQDTIILNFGPYVNQRLYYTVQDPDAVPFHTPLEFLPVEYVGLTTQELWDQFGVAVGGEVAPENTTEVPRISGLIGPPA